MNRVNTEPLYMPEGLSEVDANWLKQALAGHAEFVADPIESVSFERLGDGVGQLSELLAATVHSASGRSSELVVKLQTGVGGMHDLAMRYGYYESEVNFYNYLAARIPLRTPKVYVARFDAEHERVVIVMESFKGWLSPDQIAGATLDQMIVATEQLAGLTAAFWDEPLRQQHTWLRNPESAVYASAPGDYLACTDPALQRFGDQLPASAESAMRRIGSKLGAVFATQCKGHQALAHWDYRVENLFFGPTGEFAVIDWQLMMITRVGFDLAYLLGTNVDVSLRREHESELMDRYLDTLARHGVRGYGRDELDSDFRLALLAMTCIPVIGGATGDETNARSMKLYGAIGSRAFQAVEDWDALAALPD